MTDTTKSWNFEGCFDRGLSTYVIRWIDPLTGWMEIEYEDGTCMVFQGAEAPKSL